MRTWALVAVLTLATAVSGCASAEETGTPAHRLKVWESGTSYHQEFAAVTVDVTRIDKARASGDAPAVVEFDCVTLGQDVNMDYDQLPTPDTQLSSDLGNADTDYLNYSTSCVNHKGASATMVSINHYLLAGNQAMDAAKARVKQVLG